MIMSTNLRSWNFKTKTGLITPEPARSSPRQRLHFSICWQCIISR